MKRLALIAVLILPLQAMAYGPYEADLVRVIDGDTLELDVRIWPGMSQRINMRVDGINTPEKRTRDACEKEAGIAASAYAEDLVSRGGITVDEIHLGKYAGRVLGRVFVGPVDFGQAMISAGHARPYHGERRGPWCE